nr:hypothetical protein [Tanacetum cinerariifolium]
MADHSQHWYNKATTWKGNNHNSNDIVVITKRVYSFGYDMQKLQESIHAIQVKHIGFLEETINKFMEESNKKQTTLDEWIRKFKDDIDLNLRMLDATTKNMQVRAELLTHAILKNNMVDKANTKIRKDIEVRKEQEEEAHAFRMLEGLKKLKINRSLIHAIKKRPEYL